MYSINKNYTRYHTWKLLAREFGIKDREIGVKIIDWTGNGKRDITQKRRCEDENIDSNTVASFLFYYENVKSI